jgi:hypothetical protein
MMPWPTTTDADPLVAARLAVRAARRRLEGAEAGVSELEAELAAAVRWRCRNETAVALGGQRIARARAAVLLEAALLREREVAQRRAGVDDQDDDDEDEV